MSNELKCPFCQQELDYDDLLCSCINEYWVGTELLWQKVIDLKQELDRTKKQLKIAVDALKRLEKELYFNNAKQTGHIADSVMSIPIIALEQITALKQKDNGGNK